MTDNDRTGDPIADAMMAAHKARIAATPEFAPITEPVKRRPPRTRRHSVRHRAFR